MKKIPRAEIYSILSQLKGNCGVYIEHLGTGEVMEVNGQWVCPSASVIKVPMAVQIMKAAAEGKFDWNAPQDIAPVNRVGGTGILYRLDEYYKPSLATATKLMIQMSDNMCTNHIMDLIGIEEFNRFWTEMGYPSFKLMRKMMDWEEIKKGKNNYLNAWDTGRLMAEIARGNVVSREICDGLIEIMRGQFYRGNLPQLVPSVPSYMPPEAYEKVEEGMVLVANKTGGLPGVAHDAGIFELPDGSRYVIVVLTTDLENDVDGADTCARIAKACYEAFC